MGIDNEHQMPALASSIWQIVETGIAVGTHLCRAGFHSWEVNDAVRTPQVDDYLVEEARISDRG